MRFKVEPAQRLPHYWPCISFYWAFVCGAEQQKVAEDQILRLQLMQALFIGFIVFGTHVICMEFEEPQTNNCWPA